MAVQDDPNSCVKAEHAKAFLGLRTPGAITNVLSNLVARCKLRAVSLVLFNGSEAFAKHTVQPSGWLLLGPRSPSTAFRVCGWLSPIRTPLLAPGRPSQAPDRYSGSRRGSYVSPRTSPLGSRC